MMEGLAEVLAVQGLDIAIEQANHRLTHLPEIERRRECMDSVAALGVLQKAIAAGTLTTEKAGEALDAWTKARAPKGGGKLTCKVSEKGAVSVYGFGRFPVTLYAEQWERVHAPDTVKLVRDFIAENRSKLKVKGQ